MRRFADMRTCRHADVQVYITQIGIRIFDKPGATVVGVLSPIFENSSEYTTLNSHIMLYRVFGRSEYRLTVIVVIVVNSCNSCNSEI